VTPVAPPKTPRRERLLLGTVAALGVVMLAFALLGDQGWREVRRLRAERDRLATEIQQLAEREAALRREVTDLQTNERAIEARARADLGMIKPGETIFLLPERHAIEP